MLNLVNQINEKLGKIIEEIGVEVDLLTSNLEVVQSSIDSKIEEAKGYKVSVDEYKENINVIESEIAELEHDLDNLKNNYGNKGLDAIVDVGTKEINSKIVSKQVEVSKYTQKINELTDRARTIKELLISLKKDKKEKKERLDNLNTVLEYYSQEFDKIIDYSSNNVDSLVYIPSKDIEINYEVPVMDEVVDDSPIFDEIESIDKEENDEVEEKNIFEDDLDNQVVKLPDFNIEQDEEVPVSDVISSDNVMEDEHIDDTISSLFAKDLDKNIDFKALNESIDAEYENVFGDGSSEEIDLDKDIDNDLFTGNDNTNIFDKYSFLDEMVESKPIEPVKSSEDDTIADIFGNNYKPSYDKGSSNDDIVNNFFITNKLDYSKFNAQDKDYIKKVFNSIGFSKIIEVLRKHNIDNEGLYYNAKLFEMESSELDSIISKLLVSGQTTHDISLVLNTLSSVSLMDINEVINSYGKDINNVNITDIIIKAKHLSDIGRSDR